MRILCIMWQLCGRSSERTGQEVGKRVEGFCIFPSALSHSIHSEDRVEQVNARHTWEVKPADLDGKLEDGEGS